MTLKSTIDTPAIGRAIERVFRSHLRLDYGRKAQTIDVFYEHGQWWARVLWKDDGHEPDEQTFSVVDTSNGFGFEEV